MRPRTTTIKPSLPRGLGTQLSQNREAVKGFAFTEVQEQAPQSGRRQSLQWPVARVPGW
jgi:hypothetical protein